MRLPKVFTSPALKVRPGRVVTSLTRLPLLSSIRIFTVTVRAYSLRFFMVAPRTISSLAWYDGLSFESALSKAEARTWTEWRGLPNHVKKAFEAFLDCGVLTKGF